MSSILIHFHTGSIHYCSPEIILNHESPIYSQASDVYAFTVLCNEVLCRVVPYGKLSQVGFGSCFVVLLSDFRCCVDVLFCLVLFIRMVEGSINTRLHFICFDTHHNIDCLNCVHTMPCGVWSFSKLIISHFFSSFSHNSQMQIITKMMDNPRGMYCVFLFCLYHIVIFCQCGLFFGRYCCCSHL